MKIEPRTWTHTFLQGADEERLRELRAEAERLKPKQGEPQSTRLLHEPDLYQEKAKEADEFAAEAKERGISVTLRNVGRKKWAEFVKAHPPREGDEEDAKAGFNVDDFPEALVPACIASLGGQEGFTSSDVEEFLDSLSPAQFDLLSVAAFQLHNSLGADPNFKWLSAHAES